MHKKNFFLVLFIIFVVFLVKVGPIISNFSPILFQFIFHKGIELRKNDDAIGVLLLGIGGGTHEGPDLTDTIIFSNIDQKNNKVTLVSIPRDLWVPDLAEKINTAYAIGEGKRNGGGITLIRAIVAKIVNKPVDYVVVINFDGFVKAVDLIGGLSITVDNTLDDYQYPIEGKEQEACGYTSDEIKTFVATASAETQLWDFFSCRYEHLHFDKGPQVMNGKQALAFVRSRHATGDDGTDFARSKRQEKIISAFKEKVFSVETLLNPIKLLSLYSTLSENIDTDVTKDEIDDFAKLAKAMQGVKMQSAILDYGDEQMSRPGLLVNPEISSLYDNQWVLIPRTGNGNFSEIQSYINCVITKDSCPVK